MTARGMRVRMPMIAVADGMHLDMRTSGAAATDSGAGEVAGDDANPSRLRRRRAGGDKTTVSRGEIHTPRQLGRV